MRRRPTPPGGTSRPTVHVATITHEGRIWDVYLDFEPVARPHDPFRARLRFEPPAGGNGTSARTALIVVEDSYEEAVSKARSFNDHQLQGMLRSSLPDEPDD
jgi:hypothetical protein